MTRTTCLTIAACLALATGCKQDRQLISFHFNSVAVTAGDFDDVAEPLNRMVVEHETYEGIISTATWDPDFEYEQVALKVEDLFADGRTLGSFGATFVASGTRGLGMRQYNGLDPDDHLLEEETVITNVQQYVNHGGVLVCTDWSYDLVEKAWPGMIDFLGDDAVYDDAQRGEIGRVDAAVTSEDLADDLEMDQIGLWFNYSNWAVIEDVDDALVTVHAEADIEYKPTISDPPEAMSGVPVMVSFVPEDATGRVVFTSFHIDAQNDPLMDEIIRSIVGSFEEHTGETADF